MANKATKSDLDEAVVHLKRLIAHLEEATIFAVEVAPLGDHNAGLWHTAVEETKEFVTEVKQPIKGSAA